MKFFILILFIVSLVVAPVFVFADCSKQGATVIFINGIFTDEASAKKERDIFEQDFNSNAEFCGVGKIRECNSGPYCFFSIRRIYSVIGLLIHKIKRICRGKRKK